MMSDFSPREPRSRAAFDHKRRLRRKPISMVPAQAVRAVTLLTTLSPTKRQLVQAECRENRLFACGYDP